MHTIFYVIAVLFPRFTQLIKKIQSQLQLMFQKKRRKFTFYLIRFSALCFSSAHLLSARLSPVLLTSTLQATHVPQYTGSPRSTRPNKENPKNLEIDIFISQRSLFLARYTFPSDA